MLYRFLFAVIVISVPGLSGLSQTGQTPEAVSPLGVSFYSMPDEKGEVAEAEKRLTADPENLEMIIALGRAQASVWRYRDAIATYTRGIEKRPGEAMLYRHRGHRYISTRQFDKAITDLERAASLNDKNFDIWYHLGLAYYLEGEFAKAATAYEKCRAVAEKDDSLIAVSDWLYMTYRRQNKPYEAARVLERITPDLKVEENHSYFARLLFYKGLKKETDLMTDQMSDLDIATVGYGMGNWHLYNGNTARAKEIFEKIVSGKYWPAFGFISAETELARMRDKK
ncbi:MAG: tetratricopeptide repeat protein [Blastocatellia bacterium]|nr:tetratricopeptide repeat protein [Blastocatellia bacterium]